MSAKAQRRKRQRDHRQSREQHLSARRLQSIAAANGLAVQIGYDDRLAHATGVPPDPTKAYRILLIDGRRIAQTIVQQPGEAFWQVCNRASAWILAGDEGP